MYGYNQYLDIYGFFFIYSQLLSLRLTSFTAMSICHGIFKPRRRVCTKWSWLSPSILIKKNKKKNRSNEGICYDWFSASKTSLFVKNNIYLAAGNISHKFIYTSIRSSWLETENSDSFYFIFFQNIWLISFWRHRIHITLVTEMPLLFHFHSSVVWDRSDPISSAVFAAMLQQRPPS